MKRLILASVVVFLSSALAAGAQGIITGSVTGTVQDKTGASLPNASIVATNAATGIQVTAEANSKGDFTINNLPVGTYTVRISAPRFDKMDIGNVIVGAGQTNGLGIKQLQIGSATETVEVSTTTNLLETVQSQVTTTFDSVQVASLPTNGGFDELALLVPGVVSTHGNNRANTNGAGISSNGQRGRSNNFEIDGQSNNDNSVTGPQIFMGNEESIQEVQFITNNFSAQYGRDAGTVVNYLTKSGTNAYHGTALYRYLGSWLSSLTQGQKNPLSGYCAPGQTTGCTPPFKPRYTNNQFGGSLGGPILRDKLFGFGSAYFVQGYNGVTTTASGTLGGTTGYMPTAAGFNTLGSAYPNNPGIQSLIKYGPQTVPIGTFAYIGSGPATATVSDGTTTVQIPVQQYQRSIHPHSTDEELLGRLDYQATNKDRFYIRYFYQDNPSYLASGTVTTGGIVNVTDNAHSVGADWSHTFSTRFVNQLRYSFQQARINFEGGGFPNCTTTSFTSCPASLSLSTSTSYKLALTGSPYGATTASIGSFGLSTSYPQGRIVKDTQIQDNLSMNLGKHSITVGFAYEFQNSPNVFLPNISGGYTFNGFNGLLTDTTTLGLAIGSPNIHFTEPDWAAYFQDDWKVSPQLTLNLGMRWEYFSQSINLLHNISVTNQTGSSPLWNTTLPLSQTTFPYIPQDYKHFEPRIGFAYNPSAMRSLVIRGGYAINIAPAYYNIFLNSYGGAPVVLSTTITGCNNTTKLCTPSGGANYTTVHALNNQYLPTGGNPGTYAQTLVGNDFRQPVTQTYQLGFQKEIKRIAVMEVRYVGAHTSGDFQSVNANPAIGTALAAFPSFFNGVTACTTSTAAGYNGGNGRTNCNNSLVRTRLNSSFEIYNGLQTSVRSRDYHGLTANLSYTWSRTVDNASEIFGTNGAGTTVAFPQNPLNWNVAERGVSGQSYPNVTSLGLVWVVPYFKNDNGFAGHLLGGFQLNSIYVFNSGQPFTPTMAAASSGNEANYCDYLFDATYAGLSSCRPILANPAAPIGNVGYNAATMNATNTAITGPVTYVDLATKATVQRSQEHWLINNYAEALTMGNPYPGVGRNTLRGDSYNNVDVSVFKNTKVGERVTFQLGVYLYNALNRGYYSNPDPAIEDAGSTFMTFRGGTGTTFGGGSGTRNVQVGGKLIF